jgi:hypothetical protein
MAKAGLVKLTAPSLIPQQEPEPPSLPLFEITPEAIDAATIEERDAIIADLETWGMLHLPYPAIAMRFPMEKVSCVLGFEHIPECDSVWLTMMLVENDKHPLTIAPVYTCSKMSDTSRGRFTKEQMDERIAQGTSNLRLCVIPSGISPNFLSEHGRASKWMRFDDRGRDYARDFTSLCFEAVTILLASLAARNVVKDTRTNSHAGGNAPHLYVDEKSGVTYLSRTIVRPPPASEMDSDPDHPPRGEYKPHLRRGHTHTVVCDTTKPQPQRPDIRVTVVGTGRAGRRVQWFAPTYVNVDKGFIAAPHYVVRS